MIIQSVKMNIKSVWEKDNGEEIGHQQCPIECTIENRKNTKHVTSHQVTEYSVHYPV